MVTEFHTAMKLPVGGPFTPEVISLRDDLIAEEADEVSEVFEDAYTDSCYPFGVSRMTKAQLLKELADLLYVTIGTAVSFGLPITKAFERVHQSNMSKLVDGKPLYREDGKVLKGPNYQPPVLDDLIEQGGTA